MSGKYLHLHLDFDYGVEIDSHMLICLLPLPPLLFVGMIENGNQNLFGVGSLLIGVGITCHSSTLK